MLFLAVGPGLLVNPETAKQALKNQGYTNITLSSPQVFMVSTLGCDEGDSAKFDATATNRLGQKISLVVCVGWPFRGASIRTPPRP